MDWRWKALVAKADPAQLKASITEWLLPRMEIGLLHGGVTEKMCDAWLSTIIDTLSRLSGMSTAKTINRKAFCLLSGIPDFWLLLHTIRTTELIVNLNTTTCLSGSSTIARFCDFMGKKSREFSTALKGFDSKRSVNLRSSNRLGLTLQFLKKHNLSIPISGIYLSRTTRQ